MVYTPSELDEYMISILLAFLSTRSKSAVSWSREFRYRCAVLAAHKCC